MLWAGAGKAGSAIAILGTRHKSVGGSAAPPSLAAQLASRPQAAEQGGPM